MSSDLGHRRANPFVPSFGTYPHLLVGRDDVLDDFDDAFDNPPGAPGQVVLLSGQRGMGKTVLLDSFQRAAHTAGWLTISEGSSTGLLDRLTRDHLPRLLELHGQHPPTRLHQVNAQVAGSGGGASWKERYPRESTLRSQITELTDQLRDEGRGLAITVDEVQASEIEELGKLGEVLQFARRESRPLAFAAAGLSAPIQALLEHEGTTFLRRAEHYVVGPVQRADVRSAIAQTVADAGRTIDASALDFATDAVAGYPFMIQLVGHRAWKQDPEQLSITLQDVESAVPEAQRRLGRNVHSAALKPLSAIDRTYLLAMAQDDGPSRTRAIAQRMNVNPQYASVYRRRLIDDGIIEPAGHGKVRFTIPYLAEYLREHAAHEALEQLNTATPPDGDT